ncbi:MAG TPA: efflux RND transporter periplasmic adaptor subunit [Cyanobacteria bacterium UBA11371]|nr:efflux RND transporter periplasmic adaptor subunit [Cyanobacteria bacterium UBA11371]HBE36398.1 efflux RND transporter periplasmic adaptor subunit [Cyanobacteria bacterium UBA11368]
MDRQQYPNSVNGSAKPSLLEDDRRVSADIEQSPQRIWSPVADETEKQELDASSTLLDADHTPPAAAKTRRTRGVFLALTILLLVAGGGFAWQWWQTKSTPNPASAQPSGPRSVPVRLAVVQTSTLEESSEFVGTLEAQRTLPLRPEIDGRLSELFVKAGDVVRPGDIIARMESEELRAQLVQARANLLAAQARLKQLQVGSRPEEIAQAQARLAEAQARLAEAQAGSRPEEIAQARARLAQAQARLAEARAGSRPEEIAQARARLAQAQAQLTAAQTSNPQQIAQAQAQVQAAQAQLDLASQRLRANQSLAEQGAISQQRLQEIIAEYRTAQASLEQAKRRVAEVQNGTSPGEIAQRQAAVREAQQALNLLLSGTRREEIAQAEASVAEAQQGLRQLQNGSRREEIARLQAAVERERQALRQLQNGSRPEEIAQAQAQVAQAAAQVRAAEVRLGDSAVRAPFAGIIGDIPVKRGEYLRTGDTLTTLTQNQALDLNLSIPIEKASQLRPGLPVQLTGAKGEAIATGSINFISPQVNTQSQAILAKATFDNTSRQLRDGQFVRAKIIWNSRPNAVVIPTTAIIFQGEERFVYVASNQAPGENSQTSAPSLVAKRQPIQLGLVKGDKAEVISGLPAGTQIVVSGTQKLRDGAPIVPLPGEERSPEATGAGEQGRR